MAKSIKRRGKRVGPKHRIYITLALPTVEALRAEGEKLGYSISALAQRVIDRGVAAGLLYGDTPSTQGAVVVSTTLMEEYIQLSETLRRLDKERIEGLHEHLKINDQMISHLQQGLDDYTEIITEQARTIQFYEQARVRDVEPGVKEL